MATRRLKDELKKRLPFDSLEQEASLNLARTADRHNIAFARLFREYGLTSSQYNVLRILRGEGGPLPILEVAGRMVAAVPGITGLVDRLEAMGLVCRDRSTEDRRVVFASITPRGTALLGRLDRPVAELHGRLLGHLSKADLAELIRLLEMARQVDGDAD
ncbi:MarR family winged helix-turn-helix transcriptional regulator [Tautonia plasticadhaerens]|uniref:HTH-type transcriptional regulator MhqR n=1 Tax=Tautonia plasticadhaerens TaxID=2527974 RepID=A0A518H4F1_9BACT|nr:MarR family transcriptional regulator [Tautonia plasticadhaerens]QDV35725.1 HTH-type transcriptional regulator MhqR [Tautonia plasticadhaerens]